MGDNPLLDGLKKLQSQTQMFDPVSEAGMKTTPPGMAHWSGTGPDGKTCRECAHYTNEGRYTATSKGHATGQLKPGRCLKYQSLTKRKGAKFPFIKLACKHFQQHPNPPVAVEQKYGNHGD